VALDPDLATALAVMAKSVREPMHTASPVRARRAYRRLTVGARPTALVSDVRAKDLVIPAAGEGACGRRDIPARLYHPNTVGPWPLIVFFHGGGWVIGDLDTHDNLTRTLCQDADAAIVAVDYRLAPEYPFPAAFDDAAVAVLWCWANLAELGGADRFAVAGDSAGANLAAAVAWHYRHSQVVIGVQLLICPLLELTPHRNSRRELATGFLLNEETIAWFVRHYAGGRDPDELASDPRVCPAAYPRSSGLRGALVVTAEFDPLQDEGQAYAARLAAEGIPVATVELPGMIHGFADFANVSPAAHRQLRRCAREFGRALRCGV
jgi:acetyl esterase